MQTPLPILLALDGRTCAVVGGSALAEEKARCLEEAGARVVRHICGENVDFHGSFVVISALSDSTANAALRRAAHAAGALFNALDDPANCDFFLPAIHRQ
jgi:precorrin-2 dehydrogenase/sirohydrochlorin ferrochelatase